MIHSETKICDICGTCLPLGMSSLLCPTCLLNDSESFDAVDSKLRIGSCVIHHEIARGGMGVVYYAEQIELGRPVALKILLGQMFASPQARERFRVESSAVAKLRHPGIVAIHEVGEHDGQPYFTMDYIGGMNLEAMMRKDSLPSHFSAQVCQALAQAVHYAHDQGVYHRDLKPSNIMLDEDNQPILTDFGLAHTADQNSQLTLSGQLVGTPSYIPPERAAGLPMSSCSEVRGDVYGIGAILYHMLTGRAPFLGESIPLTLNAVINDEPVAPHRLRPGLHRDLETICLKCLQKNPLQRYSSAGDLAADLNRYMKGESILASPDGVLSLLGRRIRRHPAISTLIFALILTLLAGVATTLRQSKIADAARNVAVETSQNLQREVYATDILAASIAYEAGNQGNARAHLERHLPAHGKDDLRGFEWHYLAKLCKGRELAAFDDHQHIVTSLAWSPDGLLMASADLSGKLILWQRSEQDGARLMKYKTHQFPDSIYKLCWLGDQEKIIITGPGENTLLVNVADGSTLHSWPGRCIALSSDGSRLAVANSGPFHSQSAGDVTLYALPSGEKIRTVMRGGRALAFSPDGAFLAVAVARANHADEESGIEIFAINRPEEKPLSIATNDAIWALQYSTDGKKLFANTFNIPSVLVWDTVTNKPLSPLLGHKQRVWSCSLIDAGKKILTTGSDRTIRLWDAESHAQLPLTHLNGHENEIWTSSLHPKGNILCTGDKNGEIRVWEWPPRQAEKIIFPKTAYTTSFFSRDSSKLYVSTHPTPNQSSTTLHDLTSGQSNDCNFPEMPVGQDANGNTIVLMMKDSTLDFIAPDGVTLMKKISINALVNTSHTNIVRQGINEQGTRFYRLVADEGLIHYVDLVSGISKTHSGMPVTEYISSAISPDGRYIAAATWQTLYLLDTTSKVMQSISNAPHWASALAFHPDHKRLISSGIDGTLKIFSLLDLSTLATLRGHLENANGIAISPDGLTIASVENNSGIKLWRVDTLREVMEIKVPNTLGQIFFSPDGRRLAFTHRDDAGESVIQILDTR
jgi:eukaryotic-like serine/threonine-protein kinase